MYIDRSFKLEKSKCKKKRWKTRFVWMIIVPIILCLFVLYMLLSLSLPIENEQYSKTQHEMTAFQPGSYPTKFLKANEETNLTRISSSKNQSLHNEDVFVYQPIQNSRVAIFYNIFIPIDQGTVGEQRAKAIIEDQLDQIGLSSTVKNGNVSLYYNTIGKNLMMDNNYNIVMATLCERNQLECHHIQHFKSGYEDVTLERVHEFCQTHSDFRAMYIHSKGSYHDMEKADISQTSWRRNMMSAVTSPFCLEPKNDSCTACGLVALPWPTVHFAGNFFIAHCRYIQQLLPPRAFAKRMSEVVSQARVKIVQHQFVANLFPPVMHYYGVARFAMEHWLGSHPSMSFCDVSSLPAVKPWYQPGPAQHPFEFAMFPRHSIDNEGWPYIGQRRLQTALRTPHLRLREYFLLPGNLFRWFLLYNSSPPADSWIWSWFPDGELWQQQIKKHEKNAVDIVTASFSTNNAKLSARSNAAWLALEKDILDFTNE